jgi:DNA-binding CsgD family transcriptional regulator
MTLFRASGGTPLTLLVAPLPTLPLGTTAGDRANRHDGALLFVFDSGRGADILPDLLRQMHALTPAESRLAALLGQGFDLAEASDRLGITRETARSRLKIVLAKMGIRRQSELVRVILSGPAMLRGISSHR